MTKKDKSLTPEGQQREPGTQKDDVLFEALGKSKKRKRRKILITVVSVLLVLAIIAVAGVSILRRKVRQQFASAPGEVLSYEVRTGTISTVVSGSGTVQNVDTEAVTIPSGVEVTEILVEYGDTVAQGDLLAAVDMSTVRTAMSELQGQIEELDRQISDAEGDKVSSSVKAGVSGRVKKIYAEKGADIPDIMAQHGALAVISLDGYMALDIETDVLSVADTVTAERSGGDTLKGIVESVAGSKATILVTDNGPQTGEEVTVATADGTQLGTAALYIHAPLSVTSYAGTVSRVNVRENQKVSSSSTLFALTNTASSANYDALLRERSQAEQTLLELLRIQRGGGIAAPISGSICFVGDLSGEELTCVAEVSPDVSMSVTINIDEGDILSLALGQEADILVSSVSEDKLTGIVTQIDKTAASGYYTAVITLGKTEGMLPGMTASVDVRIEGVDDAVIIPVDALHRTSTGAYVYTSYNAELQEYGGKTDVVVGLQNNNYVEIKSGLTVADTVYYTESASWGNLFGGMGFPGMPGGTATPGGNFGGGERSDFSGGERPDFSGGEMPDFGGRMPGNRG